MIRPGLQVDNSPFRPDQVELLGRLLPTLTPDQGVWLSGYLAGVQARAASETQATATLSEGAAGPPPRPRSSTARKPAMPNGWPKIWPAACTSAMSR